VTYLGGAHLKLVDWIRIPDRSHPKLIKLNLQHIQTHTGWMQNIGLHTIRKISPPEKAEMGTSRPKKTLQREYNKIVSFYPIETFIQVRSYFFWRNCVDIPQ